MAGFGIDTQKMPLGKLTKRHVQSGYQVLREIDTLIGSSIPNRVCYYYLLCFNPIVRSQSCWSVLTGFIL